MSQVLIQQYLNQLQDLRKVSGTHRESVVREAFKDPLWRAWGCCWGWRRFWSSECVEPVCFANPAEDLVPVR
jgi:hypothetical protein